MKAAAEGRKKQVEKKQKNAQPSAQINSDNRSPRLVTRDTISYKRTYTHPHICTYTDFYGIIFFVSSLPAC